MTTTSSNPYRAFAGLAGDGAQLQETIRLMEQRRQHVMEQRRRHLLIVGCGISMLIHMALIIYLSLLHRAGPIGDGGFGNSTMVEFAILNDEELTELEEMSFDELETDAAAINESLDDSASPLDPEASLASAAATTDTSLGAAGSGDGGGLGLGGTGGAGGDEGFGLGGGGGGASFFGIGAKGTRFAYIVDISGSMGENRKLEIAMRELARSISDLPDYAHLYIILFETGPHPPPMQEGWMRARKTYLQQVIRWLGEVDPSGGTQPREAFMQVFALQVRPDVVFFLTDGQFNDITPEEVNALNARGKKAVINTIQFGDPNGQEVLRAMANQSGGIYRFVPATSSP